MRRIAIGVVHHNEIFREGVTLLLSQQPDFGVIASCNGDLTALGSAKPEVVLLFLSPREHDSIRRATDVLTATPNSRVIVIGLRCAYVDLACFLEAGVYGFVLDDAAPDELRRAIRLVAEGTHVLPPAMAKRPFSAVASDGVKRGQAARGGSRLTRREREVIARIAEGQSNKEIARHLGVAFFTVRSHVRNIMEKLDLHSRLQIAVHVHREQQGESSVTSRDAVGHPDRRSGVAVSGHVQRVPSIIAAFGRTATH